jgi:uncharacterized membrane protein YdjX (TVP38/TMEM64 family)
MRTGPRLALIATAALALPLVPFVVVGELPGERWLSSTDQHAWLFALTGAGLLAADILLPIPSSIVGTMLGARLGFWPGLAAGVIGMTTGQAIAYAAARWLLRHSGPDLPRAPTLIALFLSRPVPVLAEATAFAAGATRVDFPQFLLACGAGNLVYVAALAGNGAMLLPDALLGPGLALPMLLPVAAWLGWQWWRRRDPEG